MSYQHILVAVDDSEIAHRVVEQAFTLGSAYEAKLTFVSAIALDPLLHADFYQFTPAIEEYFKVAEQKATEQHDQIKQRAQHAQIEVETKIVREVLPADAILSLANELEVDCIVMGSHGRRGFEKLLLGSVAQKVLNQTNLPVLIIK